MSVAVGQGIPDRMAHPPPAVSRSSFTVFSMVIVIASLAMLAASAYVAYRIYKLCVRRSREEESTRRADGPAGGEKKGGVVLELYGEVGAFAGGCCEVPKDRDCAVCLAEHRQGEMVLRLRECGHCYHADCVSRWLQAHESCPLCRQPITAKDRPPPQTEEINPAQLVEVVVCANSGSGPEPQTACAGFTSHVGASASACHTGKEAEGARESMDTGEGEGHNSTEQVGRISTPSSEGHERGVSSGRVKEETGHR